jgi:2-oxoglutarate ferredoxin oxidoreductase subunit alpha
MTQEKILRFWQGNEACAYAALNAGCRFFGGYPITPSTEVAELMSRELPLVNGTFIQMEDEIASIGSIIGASIAGVKSMTATSGPGFSLMQELLGLACITEVPCVIVDVQRAGPSTGLPTQPSQGDVMQARWGTHGDHYIIALSPSSVQETYSLTFDCFNLSEMYRTPVVLLLDEVVGHMREKIRIPRPAEMEIYDRQKPTCPPEEYLHYGPDTVCKAPFASFGEGYRFHVESLTHDERGFPTNRPDEAHQMLERQKQKFEAHADEIVQYDELEADDAEVLLVAYGCTARPARQAVKALRQEGIKAGLLRPIVIWPFPEKALKKRLEKARLVVVPEMNWGQIVLEVERFSGDGNRVVGLNRYDGQIITPAQIIAKVKEEL